MQIYGLTLEFEVQASKRRLRWEKKQYAICALHSTSPKEGEGVKILVLLCKLECFAVCWELKLCLAITYKLKGGERGENFGNIASISQTHLFHKIYIHISLSTHTSGGIAKPVAL